MSAKTINYTIKIPTEQSLLINGKDTPIAPRTKNEGPEKILDWAITTAGKNYQELATPGDEQQLVLTITDINGKTVKATFTDPRQNISFSGIYKREPKIYEAIPKEEMFIPSASPQKMRVKKGPAAKVAQIDTNTYNTPLKAPANRVAKKKVMGVDDSSSSHEAKTLIQNREGSKVSPAPASSASPGQAATQDEINEREIKRRGWKLAHPAQVARPNMKTTKSGDVKKAKSPMLVYSSIAVTVLLLVAVFVGFGSQSYTGVCIDQRTMTRVANSSACSSESSTNNFRWWYVQEEEGIPEIGQTIDRSKGSFNSPGDANITRL